MAYAERHTVSLTTDSNGDATGYTPVVTGRIITVVYTKTNFADGSTFTITTEDSTQNVWVETGVNATATVAPRQATHDTVGAASLYAAGGEPVEDYIYAANERIKIVVSNGGDTKTGAFTVIVA